MNKFIKNGFLFAVVVMLILFVLQYIADNGLKKCKNDKFYDINLLYQHKIQDDIIIMGSSRAWIHLDPQRIEEYTHLTCYNLGLDGAELVLQQVIWDQVMNDNNIPEVVIQNVDIFSLGKRMEIPMKYKFLPYLNKDFVYDKLKLLQPGLWKEKYIPFIKYHGYGKYFLMGFSSFFSIKKYDNYTKYKGFKYQDRQWNDDFKKFQAHLNGQNVKINKDDIEAGLDILNGIINDCKKYNTTLIFVYTPEYVGLQKLTFQRDSIVNLVCELARKNDVEFWDYSNDSLSFSKEYFYNSLHLNKKGAQIFSEKFAQKLSQYLDHQENKN